MRMVENMCDVLRLCECVCVTLTTQGHGSSSECTPGVLAVPPLYTGSDGHQRPACNIHQLMIRMTEPLRGNETPVPLWEDTDGHRQIKINWLIT